MIVTSRTALQLSVTCREPRGRIIAVVLSLGFILLGGELVARLSPAVEPLSPTVRLVLLVAFALVLAGAAILAGYAETYTFDKSESTFVLRRSGVLRDGTLRIPLRQIRFIEEVSDEESDAVREFVVLVMGAEQKRLKLPVRLYSFRPEDRARLASMLGMFLGVPVRVRDQ